MSKPKESNKSNGVAAAGRVKPHSVLELLEKLMQNRRLLILENHSPWASRLRREATPGSANDNVPAAPVQYVLPSTGICLEEVEKDFVRQALEIAQGNQTRAARLLNISRDSLRYRMTKLD